MATGTSLRIQALAAHLEVAADTISEEYENVYSSTEAPGEYLVLAQRYFDRDAWKRDARFDGRGRSLSSYDGDEHEVKVDGLVFYVYRVN